MTARLELSAGRRMITELRNLPEIRARDGMLPWRQEEVLTSFTFRVTHGSGEG